VKVLLPNLPDFENLTFHSRCIRAEPPTPV
jgi:hypothetical protein